MEEAKGPNLSLGALTAPGERPLAGASAVAVTLAQQAPSTICVDQQAITGAHKVKARKPYIITKQRERWTDEEHQRFLEAIKKYGRAWRKIEEHVGTKTAVQIRSHAQKFMNKLEKNKETASTEDGSTPGTMGDTINIPPPRPKRKPMRPYPRKQQPSGADNSGSGVADVSGVNGAASQGTGVMAAQQQQQSKLSLPAAPRSSQQLGTLALGLGLTPGVPGNSELQQLLPLTQQLQQQQQQGQQLHLQIQPAVQLTPPGSANTGMPLAEVTEATVAAVAAAASAAAAAAAAAVVAAAGQQVQAHLQAHPPQGFPFFGLPPSLLAQITLQNPALESMAWGSNPSIGHLHASRTWDGVPPQSAGNGGGTFWPQYGPQKDLYRHTHHYHHHHHHHHGLERAHQQALVGSLAEATATTTDGEDLDQVALIGGLGMGMGHVGSLGRGVGGGTQESRGSDGNSVVTEREGEGEDGRATADGPGAARNRDTDMDIDGEVNRDGDEQEGGGTGTEREDAEVENGEGEGEQEMAAEAEAEVEAEVEADGEEEGEGDGEEDATGPDGGTGAEDQGAQSNRHDNKGQQDCGAQARTLAGFTATAQYWQLLGILDAGRQAQAAAAAAAAAASGHVHAHGLGHGHVGHGHGLREGHGAHGLGRAHSHGHSHGTRGTGSGGGAPGGQGGGRAKGHSHHKDTARERDRERERERDRDQHNKAGRSASPSCFSESQVPRHRHAPGSPPMHDNACQRGAGFEADRADGGSADGAGGGGGGGGGGGRGSSDTNGSDSAIRVERNDVTENREAQGSNPTNHNNGNGNGNGSGSGSQGNGNGSSGNGHSGGNGNGSSGHRNGSSGNGNGSSGNGNGSSGRNGNGHSVKDSNNPTTNGNGHSSANGTSQHNHHHHHTHVPSLRAAPIRSPAYDAGRYPAHHETQDKDGNGASGIGARPPSSEEEDNNGPAGAPGDGGQEGGGSGSGGSGNAGSGSGGSGEGPKDSLAARPSASAGRSGPNGGSAAGGGNAAAGGGGGGGGGTGLLRRPDGLLSLGALAGPERPVGQVAGSAFRVPQTRGGGGSLPGPPNGGSVNSQGTGGHAHGGGGELSQVQRVLAQLHAQALPLSLPTLSQLQAGQPPSFAQQAMATSSAAAQPFYAAATAAGSTLQHGLPLPLLGAATQAASQQQQQGQTQQGSASAGGAAEVAGEPGGVLAAALSRLAHGYGHGSTLQLLQTLELAPQAVLRTGAEGAIEGEAAAAVLAAAAATAAAANVGAAGASGDGGGGTSKSALPAAGAPSPAGSAGVAPVQSSAAAGLSSAYLQLMAVVKEVAAQHHQQQHIQQQQQHAEEVQLQQHHRWASAASTAAQGGAALGLAALDALGLGGGAVAAAAAAGQVAAARPHGATAADGPPKKRYQQLAASSLLRAVSQPEIGSSYALASAAAATAAAAGAPPGGAAGNSSPLVLTLGLGPGVMGSPHDAGGSSAAVGEGAVGNESSPLSTLARMAAAVAEDNASEGSKAPLVRRPKPIKAHPSGHPAILLAPVLAPAPTRSAPLPSLGFRGAGVAAAGAMAEYPQQLTQFAQGQPQVVQPLAGFVAAEAPAEAAAAALAAAAGVPVVPMSKASVSGADGAVAAAAAGRGNATGGHGGAASNNARLASVGPQEAAAPSEEPPSTSGRRRRAAIQDSGSELVGAPGAGTAAAVAAAAVAALAAARGNGGGFTSSTAATAIGPSYRSGGVSEDKGLDRSGSLKAPASVLHPQGPGHDRGQGSRSVPGHERGSNEMTLSQHADIVLPSSVRESSPAAVGGVHPQALGKRPSSSNPIGSEGPQSPPRKRSVQG